MSYRDYVDAYADVSAAGEAVPDYSGDPFYQAIPCSIVTVSGDETYRGRQLEAHITHVIETRYLPDIVATTRLIARGRLSGRVFNVDSVREIDQTKGRPQALLIKCVELAPTA